MVAGLWRGIGGVGVGRVSLEVVAGGVFDSIGILLFWLWRHGGYYLLDIWRCQ